MSYQILIIAVERGIYLMNDVFSNKSVTIGIIIFLIIMLIAAFFIYFIKFLDTNKLSPSLKTTFARIPFIKDKIIPDEEIQEPFDEQKRIIDNEWLEIGKQKQEIQAWESELNKKQVELETLESELNVAKEKLETKLKNIKDLARYYELMETRNAARIMENMDDEFIIQLFQNMRNDTVAEILSNLDSKKSASITKKMSGL